MKSSERKIINIKDLSYAYPDGRVALQNVNLSISEGESVGIIGPNGAGKTTLLLHLNGVLEDKKEAVEVLGMKIEQKSLKEIRKKIGIVFQDPDDQLFMPTVFDDTAFGPLNAGYTKIEIREKVRDALKEVSMEGYEERCSHHLSLGEKKRISIATVLSMEPDILVLDEPSSSLDPRTRKHLIDLLKSLRQTRIVASHDLELVREVCQKIFLFDGGAVVAEGQVDEIMRDKKLLEAHGLEIPFSLLLEEGVSG
ncbi:MAG: ABC transporter ATP-binding protein [Nitrospirae bacterium]|nr:ABC transporter ATP-binding protein [Nitrospirota bacterium]